MARLTLPALAAALAVLAACSDANPVAQTPPAVPIVRASGVRAGVVSVRGTPVPRFTSSPAGQAGTMGITYHGGQVLLTPRVSAVYWAASTIYNGGPPVNTTGAGSADGSLVGYFLNHLGGSPYFNINTTYYDSQGTHVSNVLTYAQFWANGTYNVPAAGATVTDAQMLSMLQYAFNNGKLSYDANTVYLIFTKGTVNLGGGFGTQYCTYHSWGTVAVGGVGRTVLYAAMPDGYTYPSACSSGYPPPNGDPHGDTEAGLLALVINESVQDPRDNAWYDSSGFEPAAKCAWTWGATFTTANGGVANITLGSKNFLVPQNWVNVSPGYCALRY
jgi:hypothetical protein